MEEDFFCFLWGKKMGEAKPKSLKMEEETGGKLFQVVPSWPFGEKKQANVWIIRENVVILQHG